MAIDLRSLKASLPTLLRTIKLGGARGIPFRAQSTHTECGAACLSMVMSHYGKDIPLEEIRHIVGVDRNGANALSILQAARWFGMRGRGFKTSLENLKLHVARGSILYWDFHHFVVFDRAEKRFIEILDPAQGRIRLPWAEVSKRFTGVVLTLEPGETFAPEKRRNYSARRYIAALLTERSTLIKIAVTSAVLQFLAMLLPFTTSLLVDRVIGRADYDLWLVIVSALIFVLGYKALTQLLRTHLLMRLRALVDARLTIDFALHLASLPLSFFAKRSVGDLLLRMNAQARIRETLTNTALSALLDSVLVSLYLVTLLLISPLLAAVALALALGRIFAFLAFFRKQIQINSEVVNQEARSRGLQVQLLNGMETLKSSGIEADAIDKWSHSYIDEINTNIRLGRLNAWSELVQSTLNDASPLIMLMLGGLLVLQGQISLGIMLGAVALAAAFFAPITNLLSVAGEFARLQTELERANEVYAMAPEQHEESARWIPESLSGRIALNQVSFQYGPNSPQVVLDVDLTVLPGQMIALVGRSGCGKSTLARLLVGLYAPTHGKLSFDGIELAQYDLSALRRHLGVVTQQPFLFSATIKENIASFDPNMRFAQVVEAARTAQIHDDIMAMPMGYNTMLSDRGDTLSGGQRQRMALARALARRPNILLLDEATSALDTINESAIQNALSELRMTRIVIAHRLSTIMAADVIVVLNAGKVVGMGKHEHLLQTNSAYQALVAGQQQGMRR